ncbi:MAG: M20/M25/M40 family metallo-hydrolase [Pseudomonadota bacterium]
MRFADPESAWTNPPFEPVAEGGFLYGRGTADDKGQFFAHLKAIEMLDRLDMGPVANLILVLDSQEEVGSPYLTASRDTHSGTYGGVVPNAANELVAFLATLVDADGVVLIPGFYDEVVSPSEADRAAMARLPHDQTAFERGLSLSRPFELPDLDHWEKIMFRPNLNTAGLKAGFQGKGTKTVIPCEAMAKIDMRLVKNQTPDEILEEFRCHAVAMGLPDLEIEKGMQYLPARTRVDHPYCRLVAKAPGTAFDQELAVTPVVGESNPNHVWIEMLGLPMAEVSNGQYDCRMHAPNERFDLAHFRRGILTSALVMIGVASLGHAARS